MFDAPSFAQGEVIGGGDVRLVSYGSDAGLFVEFRDEPFHLEFKSQQEGRPVYENRVMVRVYVPGDKTKVVDRMAKMDDGDGVPSDPHRWPKAWAAYQQGVRAVQEGTPLSEWPKITRHQVSEFNAFNIHTVEQLAAVSDTALDGLGHGGRSMRDGAISWLQRAGDEGAVAKLEAKHAEEMEAMRANMQRLEEMLTNPSDEPTKRGPGRPKKEFTDGE